MEGKYKSMVIRDCLNGICHNDYVLPDIQRPFVWSHEKVEQLFDSLMCGYPIGTLMFWAINKKTLKQNTLKLLQFMSDYTEDSNEINVEFNSKMSTNGVTAVIDGQQRLTALNIGLAGSYAFHKKGTKRDGKYETRYLYLNLTDTIDDEGSLKRYDFRFLTKKESDEKDNGNWFKVGDVLDFETEEDVNDFSDERNYSDAEKENLIRLYRIINVEEVISYYHEDGQEIDRVFDIFIRANSGGEPLSKSDLLMAIATNHWIDGNIREKIKDLIDDVAEYGKGDRFRIDRDFVLKTCLVIDSSDVKFMINNFSSDFVKKVERDWSRISKSIVESFKLLDSYGFNDSSLQSKMAVIAIVYYVYINNLEERINKSTFDRDYKNRKNITLWLVKTFMIGLYGGSPDSTHSKMRGILNNHKGELFPYESIVDAYRSEGTNYTIDEEVIEKRLYSKYGTDKASYMLILINKNYTSPSLTEDHLHPKSLYKNKEYKRVLSEADQHLFEETYNTVLNLQLLEANLNSSKCETALSDWVKDGKKEDYYLNEDTSLELKDYRNFIETRKERLMMYLKEILGDTDSPQSSDSLENH